MTDDIIEEREVHAENCDTDNIETTVNNSAESAQTDTDALRDDTVAELESLREQVSELKTLLARKQEEAEKIAKQLGDFYSLFPDTPVDTLPDEVWEDVKRGNSLAAAYAIYHRKLTIRAEEIKRINQKNAALSSGKAGTDASKEFYTPDEVRAMSKEEVKENYSKIIRSMKKWN